MGDANTQTQSEQVQGGEVQTTQSQAEERKFTAADIDRAVTQRLAKQKETNAALEKRIQEMSAKLGEVEKMREEAELAGKPEAERKFAEAQREAAKARQAYEASIQERDQALKRAQEAEAARDQFIIETKVSDALAKKGCLPTALGAAVDRMVRMGGLELVRDDNGGTKIVARIGGLVFDDVQSAAEAFLKNEPWFASMASGGAGATRPGGQINGARLENLSTAELLKLGLDMQKH